MSDSTSKSAWLVHMLAMAVAATFFVRTASADDQHVAQSESSYWPMAIVADLQRTSFLERLFGRESNKAIQPRLFDHLREMAPGHTVLIGDLVFHPRSSGDWQRFTELTRGLTDMHVALGNHDYPCFLGLWPCSKKLTEGLIRQFPQLRDSHGGSRTSYAYQVEDIGIVLLDSERRGEIADQLDAALMQVSTANAILIFVHRTPFTHAKGWFFGPNKEVRTALTAATLRKDRIAAVFSGHAHGYERFYDAQTETHYIVTGGGGGPRRKYRESDDELYRSESCVQGYRPLNYVLLLRTPNGIKATTYGTCKDWSEIKKIDSFSIVVPSA